VERLDVRVPHAAADHAELRNTLLEQTCKPPCRARSNTAGNARCPGAFRVLLQRHRHAPGLPIPGVRRARAGFKRGLGDDLVIAPYASALALTVMPREACRNLQTLADQGFLGAYGFYEAVDYTPSRVREASLTPSCGRSWRITRA